MKKQLSILLATLLAVIIITSSCQPTSNKGNEQNDSTMTGTISISGAFALYPMAVKWADEFKKEYPNVRIDISAGGAGKGMADALSGMVDLGMVSRGINPEETAKGAWPISVTKDAVIPTVNSNNPLITEIILRGLSKEDFIKIYVTKEVKHWNKLFDTKEGHAMNIYTRSDACGAAEIWGKYLGSTQEGLNGIGVFGDPGIADAIRKDIYSIGYNNVTYAYDMTTRKKYKGIEVIPIDINNDNLIDESENFYNSLDSLMAAIQTGKYPSPPARELFFVSNGKPKNFATLKFLEWILTKGQAFVSQAGYVELSSETIRQELEKIK